MLLVSTEPPTAVTRVTRANTPMEWPWPEHGGIYVGGLSPTTPWRPKMGLLDAHVDAPLSTPVVGPERGNATKTTPGLAL